VLVRRLELKRRDGRVDGVILLLPANARTREFLASARDAMLPTFPIDGRRAVELLSAGVAPSGSAIVVLRD
jgi:hypothetical protein